MKHIVGIVVRICPTFIYTKPDFDSEHQIATFKTKQKLSIYISQIFVLKERSFDCTTHPFLSVITNGI